MAQIIDRKSALGRPNRARTELDAVLMARWLLGVVLVATWVVMPLAVPQVHGQTGAQQVVGARAAALGEAYVAVADDGYAAYWNPAGLPALRSQQINVSRADLFGTGLASGYLSWAVPFNDKLAFGIDWLHLGFGDDELSLGQNRVGFAGGWRPLRWLAVGASAKWLSYNASLEDLGNPAGFSSEGSGWGFDAGLLLEALPGLRLGMVLRDIGGSRVEYGNGVSRQLYPTQMLLGAVYRPRPRLALSAAVDEAGHLGAEYQVAEGLDLRGGLQRDFSEARGIGYAVGAGVRLRFAQLDYAYTHTPGLGTTHRFAMGVAFSLSASAIKIENPKLEPVFPALQKRYSRGPLGRVKLTNTSRQPLEATLSLYIPEAMDAPTEAAEPLVLAPGSETVDLNALFSGRLSDWARNRILPARIEVSYNDGKRTRSTKKQARVTVYKRNALHWDSIGAATAFISPDDEVVAAFVGGVLQPHAEEVGRAGRASRPLLRAMLLFNAISQHGVRYLADPNTPFEDLGGDAFIIDSVQYPAELLTKRAGDCDDCTVLYCSLLENISVPTAVVEAPGHILMAFDTGVSTYEAQKLGLSSDLYIERHGHVWIPVEVTLFGKSFHEAWRVGMEKVLAMEAAGQLVIADTREAWGQYPPSPPYFEQRVDAPKAEKMVEPLEADWQELRQVHESFLQAEYLKELERAPGNVSLQEAFLFNLFQLNQYERALAHLDGLQEQGSMPLAAVENNRSVAYIMLGELERAQQGLQRALAADPGNPEAMHRLEIVNSRLGQGTVAFNSSKDGAQKAGQRAAEGELSLEDLILGEQSPAPPKSDDGGAEVIQPQH
jgi:hypothetical protein